MLPYIYDMGNDTQTNKPEDKMEKAIGWTLVQNGTCSKVNIGDKVTLPSGKVGEIVGMTPPQYKMTGNTPRKTDNGSVRVKLNDGSVHSFSGGVNSYWVYYMNAESPRLRTKAEFQANVAKMGS